MKIIKKTFIGSFFVVLFLVLQGCKLEVTGSSETTTKPDGTKTETREINICAGSNDVICGDGGGGGSGDSTDDSKPEEKSRILLTEMKSFLSNGFSVDVSGSNVVVYDTGPIQMFAYTANGNVIASPQLNWIKNGQTLVLANPYAYDNWINSLPADLIYSHFQVKQSVSMTPQVGFNKYEAVTTYMGQVIDIHTTTWWVSHCANLGSGPNGSRQIGCR